MFKEIIKEMFWARVREMFKGYINQHIEQLATEQEKKVFIRLLENDDEWTHQILDNLWNDFRKKELTEDNVKGLLKEVAQILDVSAKI